MGSSGWAAAETGRAHAGLEHRSCREVCMLLCKARRSQLKPGKMQGHLGTFQLSEHCLSLCFARSKWKQVSRSVVPNNGVTADTRTASGSETPFVTLSHIAAVYG